MGQHTKRWINKQAYTNAHTHNMYIGMYICMRLCPNYDLMWLVLFWWYRAEFNVFQPLCHVFMYSNLSFKCCYQMLLLSPNGWLLFCCFSVGVPHFVLEPQDVATFPGVPFNLSCAAVGPPEPVEVLWWLGGEQQGKPTPSPSVLSVPGKVVFALF